ncbi:alpha/beta fold hydrolase [Pseudomonas syringae]|uniref:Alpha/beta fold hydrolase n=1 Tax=Pseudomonas syringae TaxID=317 RepID=A0A9Q3ZZB3_PSESX|nr:alpha/beta fold hydrolase [Pseudomonas syringae]MCF5065544.1 alpha/beta fold hydrolase [Pseudomonas syringae]MCF5075222.1 alpha/beta fold hydrolase [Pseudomonas syringae]MCF5118374.1 alpha/beta fold hydrolase [Pseudomonas syringae]MCF5378194.1 alpha/beta fold hydrolase [Pseudomonas syringae]
MSHSIAHTLAVNGIELCIHVAGPEHGQPIWLLHGFPECWHSWREQIPALTAAGYRVFAPQMRGYGQSSSPAAVADYDLLTLCADIQQAMDHFGHAQVVMVGHDWGAVVAWHLALLEPERVTRLITMSVPFAGRARRPVIEILRELYADRFNYIVYFQEPGVAERELNADIERTLRLFMQDQDVFLQQKPASARLLEGTSPPDALPSWCSREDLDVYLQTFAKHGFRGPLNWYRNFERNWQRTECLAGRQVMQPTLFLIGDRDPVGVFEAHTLKRMPDSVPHLEQHVLPNCGHWIQNEQGAQVNALMLAFLGKR